MMEDQRREKDYANQIEFYCEQLEIPSVSFEIYIFNL